MNVNFSLQSIDTFKISFDVTIVTATPSRPLPPTFYLIRRGDGIPEDVRGRIFEPFVTTKEVGRGTGQGLALSRGIVVDKLKGSLHFETETGKGTTFIIRLPVSEAEVVTDSNNKQAAE